MLSFTYLLKVISFDYGSLFISLISVIVGVILDKVWTSYTEKNKRKEEEKRHEEEKERKEEEKRKEEKRHEEEKEREEEEKRKEEKRHEEELNNIKLLIKSEHELNLNNLKKFNEKYLKFSLSNIPSSKEKNEVYLEFYKNIQSFPNISHKTWDNSLNIAHNIQQLSN